MFILYAIPVGLIVGRLLGGRLDGLAELRIRWAAIAIAALVVQLILFSPVGAAMPDVAGRAIYVASTAAVLLVVIANVRVPGAAVIAVGAAANLAAIAANGGLMPADPTALATAGIDVRGGSNSVVLAEPALRPLTDIFALPAALPLANVFSVGDVLIGVGVAVVIAAGMRAAGTRPGATDRSG